jgi:P27 family predicted phage terminase small subunit
VSEQPDLTAAPSDLDAQGRDLWAKLRDLLLGDLMWRPQDAIFLERLVRAHQTARLARERIAERAASDPEDAYLAKGSTGQLTTHPDLRIAREAEADLVAAADVLALTPEARLKTELLWFKYGDEIGARNGMEGLVKCHPNGRADEFSQESEEDRRRRQQEERELLRELGKAAREAT